MVTKQPAVLSISGIGSCVALAMRDKQTGASGLAHIVLPVYSGFEDTTFTPGRYADTAVKTVLRRLVDVGSAIEDIKAKLAGGARVLKGGGFDGLKNVQSTRDELEKNGIVIVAEDVGSSFGRSVKFNTSTGMLSVRRYQQLEGIAEFKDEIII